MTTMIDKFIQHWGSWSLLIFLLVFLAYTAFVIKEEKQSYLDTVKIKGIKNFLFPIPSWWGLSNQSESSLTFQRLDTRYDWKAVFNWTQKIPKDQNIEEQFINEIKNMKLEFDLDTSIIKNPSDFKNHSGVQKENIEIVRLEGTATKRSIDRCYIDCFLIRDYVDDCYLWAISESSILNGAVEGPYFEEVMLNFKMKARS